MRGRIAPAAGYPAGPVPPDRDVEVTNQTYANLLDQAQQLNIARASAVGNARVIDPAAVNCESPAWPKPLPVVAGGTLLGAMLMVAFVLLRQMFRRGVEDPADIELLGLPVYASIPFSATRPRDSRVSPRRVPSRRAPAAARAQRADGPGDGSAAHACARACTSRASRPRTTC